MIVALRRLVPAAALMLGCAAASADPVTVLREVPLRAEPSLSASPVATVAKGDTGEALERSGIWVQVRTAAGTGWVFSFNLRFGNRAAGSGTSGVGALGSRIVSAQPRTQVVSTIGIRGLSAEELRNARFSQGELQRLAGYAATPEEAETRAREAGLQPARLDYLEEPR